MGFKTSFKSFFHPISFQAEGRHGGRPSFLYLPGIFPLKHAHQGGGLMQEPRAVVFFALVHLSTTINLLKMSILFTVYIAAIVPKDHVTINRSNSVGAMAQ